MSVELLNYVVLYDKNRQFSFQWTICPALAYALLALLAKLPFQTLLSGANHAAYRFPFSLLILVAFVEALSISIASLLTSYHTW
jgi:hypothetical protein